VDDLGLHSGSLAGSLAGSSPTLLAEATDAQHVVWDGVGGVLYYSEAAQGRRAVKAWQGGSTRTLFLTSDAASMPFGIAVYQVHMRGDLWVPDVAHVSWRRRVGVGEVMIV
jgi:hypothetical protein